MKKRSKGYSRRKGHQFEREIAIQLRLVFPKARRHLEYQDGEAFGVDIADTGPFRFQCKKLKKYASLSLIEEVIYDPLSGEIPVLISAADNKPALAALPFQDLLWLITSLRDLGFPY